jgi:molybdopterin-guanine dinucleotide biosynthesis protein A
MVEMFQCSLQDKTNILTLRQFFDLFMKGSQQTVTGILLAGGLSKRMGQEKGGLKIGNRMLFEFPLRALEDTCDEILISTCKDFPTPLPYPLVCDETRGIGPMGGIHASLKHSSNDLNIILSYDMPLVSAGLLRYLIQESQGYDVVVPALDEKRPEPLCALYRKTVIEPFSRLIDEKSYAVHGVISRTRAKILTIEPGMPFYHKDIFLNINRAGDLQRLPRNYGHEK